MILSIFTFILPNFINNVFVDAISIPNWWGGAYPIAYYILGMYIFYEKPKFSKRVLLILLVFTQIVMFSYNVLFPISGHEIFIVYISSCIIFLLLYNVDIKNKFFRNTFIYFSNISLDIYLASSLVDKLLYPFIYNFLDFKIIGQARIILYAPVILIIVFILSSIYGSIRKLIIKLR